jgi:hypothetical protein
MAKQALDFAHVLSLLESLQKLEERQFALAFHDKVNILRQSRFWGQ